MIEILRPGPLTTVQDAGRPGWAHLGVTTSGAADRRSWRLGNRLVANPDGAASLETHVGGLSFRALDAVAVCVTGATVAVTVDHRPHPMNAVIAVAGGQMVTLGSATSGFRSYVAFRGGISGDRVLGSLSSDTLSGLGPGVVTAGARLAVGRPPWALPLLDVAPVARVGHDPQLLRVVRGPRDGWVRDANDLVATIWTVSPASDRVGVRLTTDAAVPGLRPRAADRELPSEGLVRGAIQVPPGGEPVLFLADHPVTGGYPVVGVVIDDDTDLAGQAPPGSRIRISWV